MLSNKFDNFCVGQLVANTPDQSQHVEIETTSWPTFLLGCQYVKIYEYCLAYLLMSLKSVLDPKFYASIRIKLWTVRQFW